MEFHVAIKLPLGPLLVRPIPVDLTNGLTNYIMPDPDLTNQLTDEII